MGSGVRITRRASAYPFKCSAVFGGALVMEYFILHSKRSASEYGVVLIMSAALLIINYWWKDTRYRAVIASYRMLRRVEWKIVGDVSENNTASLSRALAGTSS